MTFTNQIKSLFLSIPLPKKEDTFSILEEYETSMAKIRENYYDKLEERCFVLDDEHASLSNQLDVILNKMSDIKKEQRVAYNLFNGEEK